MMPIQEQLKPFIGKKCKGIKEIKVGNKIQYALVFNDRFGSALFFNEKGKFECIGATTRYMAK